MPGNVVCQGAKCKCSMGSDTANLQTTLQTLVKIGGKPVMTVNDCLPTSFQRPVGTFTRCKAMPPLPNGSFPPCVPVFPDPWWPGSRIEKILGMKVLTKDSSLQCALGGKVTIEDSKCDLDVKTQ